MTMIKRLIKKIINGLEYDIAKRGPEGPPIIIEDEFINWLCFANPGMLERANLYCFDCAVKNLPSDSPIIEIGSFCGLSTNVIAYYKSKYNRKNKLMTCDKWVFEGAQEGGNLGNSHISHTDYRKFVKESFMRNIKFFSNSDLPFPIEVSSDEFFEAWGKQKALVDIFGNKVNAGGRVSFVYIDGDHAYEHVKRDFLNSDRFLEVGGFLLFDDSSDGSGFEVNKAMKDVIQSGKYELIKNKNYFFKKIRA